MQNSNLLFFNCRMLSLLIRSHSTKPSFQSGPLRVKKKDQKQHGFAIKHAVTKNNSELNENFENNDESDEPNLMAADLAYDEHIRETKAWRRKVGFKITAKKFFASPKQPQMLTYYEKMCIKYLHNQDPDHWSITNLSESFPATPAAIEKILKSKWKMTENRIIKMDLKVQNNWKLLGEGKLEAPPEVLEHLKKFINRRDILLERIKNLNLPILEAKKETIWNKGEMSSIIQSYEKSIKQLVNEDTEKHELLTTNENDLKIEGNVPSLEYKSVCNEFRQNVATRVQHHHLEKKESITLNRVFKYFEPVTHEEFLNSVKLKQENKKQLSLGEKVILHYASARENSIELNNEAEAYSNSKFPVDLNLSLYSKRPEQPVDRKLNESCDENQLPGTVQNTMVHTGGRADENPRNKIALSKKKLEEIYPPGQNTKLGSEIDVGRLLMKPTDIPVKAECRKASVVRFNDLVNKNPERKKKDELYYNKEMSDIKDTAFWNGGLHSSQKALKELNKEPLGEPSDQGIRKESPCLNLYTSATYPERIKIPKNHRGSGLTFKVGDCYYDDDGEFLYRVPGMSR